MATLVIDTGQDIVGIFSIKSRRYVAYRGHAITRALRRLQNAKEIVTYNGKNRDLKDLGKFAGLTGDLPLKGIHTDMRSVCWSDRIWGSDLRSTYAMHFNTCPNFSDTYEGSNERDVYMTFKLWQLWKCNKLKVVDGIRYEHDGSNYLRPAHASSVALLIFWIVINFFVFPANAPMKSSILPGDLAIPTTPIIRLANPCSARCEKYFLPPPAMQWRNYAHFSTRLV